MMKRDAWKLTFHLEEFTPAEVERMTGLTTVLQRDWRHRGLAHKYEGQARADAFRVAEVLFMKKFSDQGKGPTLSYPHAPKVIFPLLMTALMWRDDAWGGTPPEHIYDQIPTAARKRTDGEQSEIDYPPSADLAARLAETRRNNGKPAYEKRQWLASRLFFAYGHMYYTKYSTQVIWWPNDEVVISDFETEKTESFGSGIYDRVDPKFDGPAVVLDLDATAANLVRRAPRPLVSVSIEVDESAIVQANPPYDQGVVIVTKGKDRQQVASW